MRAQFVPWTRARARRIALAVAANVAAFASVAAIFVAIALQGRSSTSEGPLFTLLMAGFFGAYLGPALFHLLFAFGPRPSGREVDVELLPGAVRVAATGHTILAKDVLGATSALYGGRYLLHVEERHAPGPHAFVVEQESDLVALRAALGVGHDGDGAVEWPLTRDASWIFAVVGAASTFMCSGMALPLLLAWPFLRAKPRFARPRNVLAMLPSGVDVRGAHPAQIPYAAVHSAAVLDTPRALQIKGADGALLAHIPASTLRRDDMLMLAAQLELAGRRARGEHTQRASALERLSAIRRGGQNAREWLARLDASGHLIARDGYRASPLDVEDLWRVAEDPSESFEDRIAAGRFLLKAQGDHARVRVDDTLKNVHADPKRVRVALDAPPDEAAIAFEEATAELEKAQKMRR
jgi:hypothetical protein